jgi:hypothetical protein
LCHFIDSSCIPFNWQSTLGSCASFGSSDGSNGEAVDDECGDSGVDDNVNGDSQNYEEDANGENAEGLDGERFLRDLGNGKVLRGRTLTASSSVANAT